ncbi:MAG: hypothetical protein AB1896_08370 [Thermodesulfobacteriota bacterium]
MKKTSGLSTLKALTTLAVAAMLLVAGAGPALALKVKVRDFYGETGVGVVCANPQVCIIKEGQTVEGLVLDPDVLKQLGLEADLQRGDTVNLTYQGGGFWTIEHPGTKASIKVKVK